MKELTENLEIWFLTGSQHLYGEEAIRQVGENARTMVEGLNASSAIPFRVVFKPVLTGPESIRTFINEANGNDRCAGLVAWMHTFSPAKMWIGGLKALRKPLAHFHTQFNRDLPWGEIDMDFMNLNQSAHGDREFGFINSRLRLDRKVVVGHWQAEESLEQLGVWMRAARAWHDWQGAKFARFGDNMRYVAVTEGDKVAAEIAFGFSVNGYGVGDLAAKVGEASDAAVDDLVSEYGDLYQMEASLRKGGDRHAAVREAARIELGLRAFLEEGGFKGFTTTFEDLHGLKQLPGLAVQRLMADGYGFGAEGDWKHAALLRAMKVMAHGRPGGTSFMEDYTYHLHPDGQKVLGAHMLEICPSIACGKASLEVHPLGIGGKEDPARLVFNSGTGPAINASLVDLGNRFRLLVNDVEVVEPDQPMPNLPVARALWKPKPDFATSAGSWILAGGAHHTGFSLAIDARYLEDFAEMAGVEFFHIGDQTTIASAKRELRWNEIFYHLAPGLGKC